MFQGLIDIDDTGDKISGTPHDNAWLQRFNSAINARWTVKVISATGTVNDLDIGEADFVIFTNTADLTVNGILAPSSPAKPGKTIHLRATAAGVVRFTHLSTACATSSRLFNLATSGPTPILLGWAEYSYNAAGNDWILTGHEQGAAITPPFNAANFTGTGTMTWTVASSAICAYKLRGRTVTLNFQLSGSIGGTGASNLQIGNGAWGGFTGDLSLTGVTSAPFVFDGGGAFVPAAVIALGPATTIYAQKYNQAAWVVGAQMYLFGQASIEVQ